MKFSLIMATINRVDEVRRFLESLERQTCRDFELVVVDQNEDNRLGDLIDKFRQKYEIIHLHSPQGLSRARNVGLNNITGDIAAFPDDDCWYPDDLLARIKNWFEKNDRYAGLCGLTCDETNNPVVASYDRHPGEITRQNIFNRVSSSGLFLRTDIFDAGSFFDESLGAGSGTPWGSAEDIDFPLRLMSTKIKLYYDPAFNIGHPKTTPVYNKQAFTRGLLYGGGLGYVLKKHRFPLAIKLKCLIRPLGGMVLSLLTLRINKAYFHLMVFWGRLKGLVR